MRILWRHRKEAAAIRIQFSGQFRWVLTLQPHPDGIGKRLEQEGRVGQAGGEGREIEREDLVERCRDSDFWKMGLVVGCPHEALDTQSLTN